MTKSRRSSNPKLVQPDWRTTHNFVRPYAFLAEEDQVSVTFALRQPLYLDMLASEESDEYYDLKIVGEGGYFIYAHKLVLCSNSPFIGNLFDDQMPGEMSTLFLPDVPIDSIQRLLEVAYNGATKIDTDKLQDFKHLLKLMGFIRLRFLLPKGVSSVVDEEYAEASRNKVDKSQDTRQGSQDTQEPCSSKSITSMQKPELASTAVPDLNDNQTSVSEAKVGSSKGSGVTQESPTESANFPARVSRREQEFVILSSDSEESDTEHSHVPPPAKRPPPVVLTPIEIVPRSASGTTNPNSIIMNHLDRERFPDALEQDEEIKKAYDSDDVVEIFPEPKTNEELNEVRATGTEKRRAVLSTSDNGQSTKLFKKLEVRNRTDNRIMDQRQESAKKDNSSKVNQEERTVNAQNRTTDVNRPPRGAESSQAGWRTCIRANSTSEQPPVHSENNSMTQDSSNTPGNTVQVERSRKRKRNSSPETVSSGSIADEGELR